MIPANIVAIAASASVPWPTMLAGGLVTGLLAVVGLGVRAIVKGDLVPRSVLQDEQVRADKMETAWRESEARLDALEGRLSAISEGTGLNAQLLQSLVDRRMRR